MKKLLSLPLFLILTLIIPYTVSAQTCGFDAQRVKQLQDPNFLLQEQQAENLLQLSIKGGQNDKAGTIYTVPVVVHVLHKNEAVGVGSNISDAQIQSAIDRLTDYYRGDGGASLDFEVEFALAQQDENCNATTGINRINATGVAGYTANGVFLQSVGADENTLKDLSRWDETQYFNIWIVSEIDNNGGGSGIQGYANFYFGNAYEGSVMMASVFGYDPGNTNGWGLNSNGDGGTVVHEIGHYLHLYHTFQGDEPVVSNVGTVCPTDLVIGTNSDGCADTEVHKRHTSQCLTGQTNDCTGSTYSDNVAKNYMSYTSCRTILTADQKTRVRNQLTTNMQSIITSRGDEAPIVTPPISAASCTPTSTNVFFSSGVMNVELNGYSVASGGAKTDNDPNGYLDNSGNCAQYFSIDATIANAMDVTVGTNGSNHRLGVWIDWNNDGDFDDVNEQQHISSGNATSSVINVSLIYPPSVNYNSSVRIRVVSDLDAGPVVSSCGSPTYGQAEDYKLYIQPNAGCTNPTITTQPTAQSGCAGDNESFTVASATGTFQWQEDQGSGFSNISNGGVYSGATSTTLTLTSTTAPMNGYIYRCVVTDAACFTNSNSATLTVDDVPGAAGAITGSASECENATAVAYSITAVSGATSYNWGLPVGATIASGTGTNSITVNFGTASGNVSVNPTNTCGNGGSAIKAVIINNCTVPNTQVKNSYCVLGTLPDTETDLRADPVAGATNYQFRWTNQGTGDTVSYTHYTWRCKLKWFSGWNYNTTYDVDVRARVGGVWGNYASTCPITTPPLPTAYLNPAYCNTTMADVNDEVRSISVPGATVYEFKLVPQGGGSTINYVSCCSFRLRFKRFTGWTYNTTYDVSVRAFINGVWTAYGTDCPVTAPPIPLVQVQSAYCNTSLSSINDEIRSTQAMYATQYEFKLVPQGGGSTIYYVSCCSFRLRFARFGGWLVSTTYDVSVRSFVEGAWTAYGLDCPITSPPSQSARVGIFSENDVEIKVDEIYSNLEMNIYPNPGQGEFVYLELKGLNSNAELIVNDIFGKTVLNQPINSDYGNYSETLRFHKKLDAGFYLITVVSGDQKTTKKLIVQ